MDINLSIESSKINIKFSELQLSVRPRILVLNFLGCSLAEGFWIRLVSFTTALGSGFRIIVGRSVAVNHRRV